MSGWDLARKAREAEPSFPVVYMTGAAADEWAVHGVPGSILLQKPFAPAQLTTAIAQLLNVAAPPGTENGCKQRCGPGALVEEWNQYFLPAFKFSRLGTDQCCLQNNRICRKRRDKSAPLRFESAG